MMMQQRYPASLAQQPQQQQSTAGLAASYQYYTTTPVYSQYPSVAVPPPTSWIQPATAATPAVTPASVANHYIMPQPVSYTHLTLPTILRV